MKPKFLRGTINNLLFTSRLSARRDSSFAYALSSHDCIVDLRVRFWKPVGRAMMLDEAQSASFHTEYPRHVNRRAHRHSC